MSTEPVCAYCLGSSGGAPTHMDHVVPRSRGGPDTPDNIVMACPACNLGKSDRLPSEWRSNIPPAVMEIEARVSRRIEVSNRAPRGPKPWASKSISVGFLVSFETHEGDVIGGEVVGMDDRGVRLRHTNPAGMMFGQDKLDPDNFHEWRDMYRVLDVFTPDHDSKWFWDRLDRARDRACRSASGAVGTPNAFSRVIDYLDHVPSLKQDAILVHDHLDTARAISRSIFGKESTPERIIEVFKLLREEERTRIASEEAQ